MQELLRVLKKGGIYLGHKVPEKEIMKCTDGFVVENKIELEILEKNYYFCTEDIKIEQFYCIIKKL